MKNVKILQKCSLIISESIKLFSYMKEVRETLLTVQILRLVIVEFQVVRVEDRWRDKGANQKQRRVQRNRLTVYRAAVVKPRLRDIGNDHVRVNRAVLVLLATRSFTCIISKRLGVCTLAITVRNFLFLYVNQFCS